MPKSITDTPSEKNTNNFNLIRTKLFIPQISTNLVPRKLLIQRLEAAALGKLTLVSAPAGYGKTTLVSAWAQSTNQTVAWLSLDENDNDHSRFWFYFITACGKINEGFGSDLLAILQSNQTLQVETLLTKVINELAEIEGQITLVLDDYHLIHNQTIHQGIEFLINQLPPEKNLVIIGRIDPDIPYTRLRAGGQLGEFRAGDLKFTDAEAAHFLNELMHLDLSDQDILSLEERTEGWISGLKLAALTLQERQDKHAFVSAFSGSHYYIIDYLLEEVMARQTEEIQHFLYQTSVMEQFCGPLCNETLKISNSRQILRKLEDANLFLIPLDYERHWYRYHHLFAEFLRQSLAENDPQSIPMMHNLAAEWYEHNGYISEAFEHLLKVEDFDRAADLVAKHARQMVEHSEFARLMSFIDNLPEEGVLKRAWLCIYSAWVLRLSGRPFNMVESRLTDAERAIENRKSLVSKTEPGYENFLSEDEQYRMLSHIYTLRAFQSLYQEDITRVLKLAHQAMQYRPESGFVRGFLEFALGWAHRFSGDLEASNAAFYKARDEATKIDNVYLSVAVTCRTAYNQVLAGELHQAAVSCREAIRIASTDDAEPYPVAGYAYVYLGGLQREWNDLETAGSSIVNGIEMCERVGYIMDQAVGHVLLARVNQAAGDWEAADIALQSANELSNRMKGYIYVRRWVEDCQVRLWLARGYIDKILQWIQVCGMDVDDELTFNRDLEHIILARALLGLGLANPDGPHMKDAINLLAELLDMTENAGWVGKTIEILVMQALAFQVRGNVDEGISALEKALMLAEPEGYIRTFVDEGQAMQELLQQTEQRGVASGYVHKLLNAFDTPEVMEQPLQEQPLIEPLSKRELEVLRLLSSELSGPEIADELLIELSTVRYHSNNIYGKLNVHNRRGAVRRAKELNLI